MINMVNLLTLLHLSLSHLENVNSQPLKLMGTRLLWNGFMILMAIMVTSRIFVLAHFPHQTLLALLLGYFCYKMAFSSKKVSFWLACLTLATPLILYFKGSSLLGFDMNWSIELAHKYCQKVRFANTEYYI